MYLFIFGCVGPSVAVRGLSLVAASGGYSFVAVRGLKGSETISDIPSFIYSSSMALWSKNHLKDPWKRKLAPNYKEARKPLLY